MTTTATAIYEHGVLRPLSPLTLEEGARVEVTVTDEASPGPTGMMESDGTTAGRTGAELARLWKTLPHLSVEDATAFERDLATSRAAEAGHPAPAWE